jgi:DNA-binding response OmpR family regulator
MASSPDGPDGLPLSDLDRTTRVLAELQTELTRSKRQLGTGGEQETTAGEVLIVDDDRDLATALSDLLRESGYRVTTVHDGAQALAHLRDHGAPSAIVLDLMMPEMPGETLLRELRATRSGEATKVIIFTAADHHYVARHGIDPADVVRKPYLPMLLQRLESRLGQGRGGGS